MERIVADIPGSSQYHGADAGFGSFLQQSDAIQFRQHQIQHKNVRKKAAKKLHCLQSVNGSADMVSAVERISKGVAKIVGAICYQYFRFVHGCAPLRGFSINYHRDFHNSIKGC